MKSSNCLIIAIVLTLVSIAINAPAMDLSEAFTARNEQRVTTRPITNVYVSAYTNYGDHYTDNEILALTKGTPYTLVNTWVNITGQQIVFFTFTTTSTTSKAPLSTNLIPTDMLITISASDILTSNGSILLGEQTDITTQLVDYVEVLEHTITLHGATNASL